VDFGCKAKALPYKRTGRGKGRGRGRDEDSIPPSLHISEDLEIVWDLDIGLQDF